VSTKEIVKQILEKKEQGIKEIFLVACGGSLVDLYAAKYFLESEVKEIKVGYYTGNEFVYATPKALGKNSLTIVLSHGGNTPESVEATKLAREHGSATITLTHNENGTLNKVGEHNVVYPWNDDTDVKDQPMAVVLQICSEILHSQEGYENHAKLEEGLQKINSVALKAKQIVADRVQVFANKYQNEKLFYVLSSGASYGMAYGFSICSLMEMQWLHASAIHSGEYFHGPFEVTDKETPFILLMNEGRTRFLDERALTFLNKYAGKVEVIDSKELGISVIDPSVVEYMNPILFYSILCVYRDALANVRQHPLSTRRYMWKVEY
jgi:fructoselysine-6-P-deglycase FrlB-like protein